MSESHNKADLLEKGRAGVTFTDVKRSNMQDSASRGPSIEGPARDDNDPKYGPRHRAWPPLGRLGKIFTIRRSALGEDDSKRTTITRILNDCPKGYPRLASFLDSDENFMLYRRFGYLQARLLLNKQDELRQLEYHLDKIDSADGEHFSLRLRSRESDGNVRRTQLLAEIEQKFKDYANLLAAAQKLAGFNKPPATDYESVKHYFDMDDPVCDVESYIYYREDVVSLKPGRENAWLDAMIEKALRNLSYSFTREQCQKTNPKDSGIIFLSRERIDMVASLIITMTILALLVIPIYALWSLTREAETGAMVAAVIGILLVFTLVFSAVLTLFTRAQRHEILAAAAAYCAVLVVFIGNVGQLGPQTAA